LAWVRRAQEASSRVETAISSLDVFAVAGEHDGLHGTAVAIVNDLAARLRCDRVSMGLVNRHGDICVRAISSASAFKQSRIVEAIENAMQEALDQRASIAYPPFPADEWMVTVAHRELASVAGQAGGCVLSGVLTGAGGRSFGAITLERHRPEPFDTETPLFLETISSLLGPMISLQRDGDRLIGGRLVRFVSTKWAELFGAGRLTLKFGAIIGAAVALFLTFSAAEYRIAAKSFLEGAVQRAAVAPFDGFVREAAVRAGDTVRQGDLLGRFQSDAGLSGRKGESPVRDSAARFVPVTTAGRRAGYTVCRARAARIGDAYRHAGCAHPDRDHEDYVRDRRRRRTQCIPSRGKSGRVELSSFDPAWRALPRSRSGSAACSGFGRTQHWIGCVLPRGNTCPETISCLPGRFSAGTGIALPA
jgi:hypothetical protein